MIPKEQFLSFFKELKSITDDSTKKNEALEVLFPETRPFIENFKEMDLIMRLLKALVPEANIEGGLGYDSDIEWYYYEIMNSPVGSTNMSVYVDDEKYDIKTPEDLYDYILSKSKV